MAIRPIGPQNLRGRNSLVLQQFTFSRQNVNEGVSPGGRDFTTETLQVHGATVNNVLSTLYLFERNKSTWEYTETEDNTNQINKSTT